MQQKIDALNFDVERAQREGQDDKRCRIKMEEKIAEISQTIKTQRNGDKKKESKAPEKKEKSMASSMRKKITFTAQSLIKDRLMKRLAEVDPIKEHKKRKTPIVYEKVKTMTLN